VNSAARLSCCTRTIHNCTAWKTIGRQATIAFDGLQHIIEIRGEGIHYTFEIIISDKGRPSFTMRKDGELVPGTVTQGKMLTAVHLAIESILERPS